jgi:hypothetical protein
LTFWALSILFLFENAYHSLWTAGNTCKIFFFFYWGIVNYQNSTAVIGGINIIILIIAIVIILIGKTALSEP